MAIAALHFHVLASPTELLRGQQVLDGSATKYFVASLVHLPLQAPNANLQLRPMKSSLGYYGMYGFPQERLWDHFILSSFFQVLFHSRDNLSYTRY